jgi:plastocyanin
MRKITKLGIGAVVGVALGVLIALVIVRDSGLAADRRPGRLEEIVARQLVRLSIPAAQYSARSPLADDAEAWREGADHFSEHCAVCHGSDGRGRSEIGPKMYPPVPDLASDAVQRLSDGALFSIIQHGVRWTGMPAFRSTHDEEDTWRLVAFVRRVPRLTPADLERHHQASQAIHDTSKTIAIDGTRFRPDDVTVTVNDMVEWVNKDPFPHNVSSTVGGFRSGDLLPDREWRFQPTKRGTFEYVCTLHSGMKAVLRVE